MKNSKIVIVLTTLALIIIPVSIKAVSTIIEKVKVVPDVPEPILQNVPEEAYIRTSNDILEQEPTLDDPVTMILTGGVLLGGIFMLTDYSTSPATEWGKVVFALGAGIITMLIRNSSGGYPEGVSFAILLMNIICPHLNKIGAKKPFGVGGAEK